MKLKLTTSPLFQAKNCHCEKKFLLTLPTTTTTPDDLSLCFLDKWANWWLRGFNTKVTINKSIALSLFYFFFRWKVAKQNENEYKVKSYTVYMNEMYEKVFRFCSTITKNKHFPNSFTKRERGRRKNKRNFLLYSSTFFVFSARAKVKVDFHILSLFWKKKFPFSFSDE